MLLSLPYEIISIILSAIDTPKDFFNVIQTCKLIYSLSPIKQKRVEFLREIEKTERRIRCDTMEKIVYTVLPNGKKEGNFYVYHCYDEQPPFYLYKQYHYINDLLDGVFTGYSTLDIEDASEYVKGYYKNGKLSGPYREWDNYNRPIVEIDYIDDIPIGPKKFWDYDKAYYSETFTYTIGKGTLNFPKKFMRIIKEFWISGSKKIQKNEYTYCGICFDGPFKIWDDYGRLITTGIINHKKKYTKQYNWDYNSEGISLTDTFINKNVKIYEYKYILNDNFEFILQK